MRLRNRLELLVYISILMIPLLFIACSPKPSLPVTSGQTSVTATVSNSDSTIEPQETAPPSSETITTKDTADIDDSQAPVVSEPETPSASESSSAIVPAEAENQQKEVCTDCPDRIDLFYFHREQRCVTCLCFEEKLRYVVDKFYEEEVASGKLTFEVISLGDESKTAIIKKFGAFGPQLFVNVIYGDTEYFRDVQEIWNWNCRGDPNEFCSAVRQLVDSSLAGNQ